MSEKKKSTKEPASEVQPQPQSNEVANPTNNLIQQLKDNVAALLSRKQTLLAEVSDIDAQLAQIRNEIPGLAEEEEPQSRRRPRATGPRSGKKLEEYVWDALKRVGEKGMTRRGVGEAVLAAGFTTPTADVEDFSKSCYVSGINKLMKRDWVASFHLPGDREARYKLTKKGLAKQGE